MDKIFHLSVRKKAINIYKYLSGSHVKEIYKVVDNILIDGIVDNDFPLKVITTYDENYLLSENDKKDAFLCAFQMNKRKIDVCTYYISSGSLDVQEVNIRFKQRDPFNLKDAWNKL